MYLAFLYSLVVLHIALQQNKYTFYRHLLLLILLDDTKDTFNHNSYPTKYPYTICVRMANRPEGYPVCQLYWVFHTLIYWIGGK